MIIRELRENISPQIHLHIINQKTDADLGWATRYSESEADAYKVTYITFDGCREGAMTLLVYVKDMKQ